MFQNLYMSLINMVLEINIKFSDQFLVEYFYTKFYYTKFLSYDPSISTNLHRGPFNRVGWSQQIIEEYF